MPRFDAPGRIRVAGGTGGRLPRRQRHGPLTRDHRQGLGRSSSEIAPYLHVSPASWFPTTAWRWEGERKPTVSQPDPPAAGASQHSPGRNSPSHARPWQAPAPRVEPNTSVRRPRAKPRPAQVVCRRGGPVGARRPVGRSGYSRPGPRGKLQVFPRSRRALSGYWREGRRR